METINESQFDEVDLNRLYEALTTQIETYNGDPDWKDEIVALKELKALIGRMLDSQLV